MDIARQASVGGCPLAMCGGVELSHGRLTFSFVSNMEHTWFPVYGPQLIELSEGLGVVTVLDKICHWGDL